MNLTTAQSAAARHDLPVEHAPKVLASAEGMVAKGLFPPGVALDRAAEGWAKRIASGRPYVSRAEHTETETMNNTDYFAHPALNWNTLKHADVSLLAYDAARRGELRTESKPLTIGNAIHCLFLRPEDFDREYVVYDGAASIPTDRVLVFDEGASRNTNAFRAFAAEHPGEIVLHRSEMDSSSTRRVGKVFEAFESLNPGKSILSAKEHETVLEARDSLMSHRYIRQMRHDATHIEHVVIWTDPVSGIECKAMLDMLTVMDGRPVLVDAKSTRGRTPAEFYAGFYKYGYHGQFAHYRAAASVVLGIAPHEIPVYVPSVETSAPFDRVLHRVHEMALDVGAAWRRHLIGEVVDARRTGHHPGADKGADVVRMPPPPEWVCRKVEALTPNLATAAGF